MKLHAVIEKTAKFVAAQGPQMEILIKAKQSNNPQFEFLNLNNRLNPYYKHVLNAVKNGYYPEPEPEPEPLAADDSISDGVATPPAAATIQPPVKSLICGDESTMLKLFLFHSRLLYLKLSTNHPLIVRTHS